MACFTIACYRRETEDMSQETMWEHVQYYTDKIAEITKCWTSGPIYLSHKLDQLKLINRLSMPKKNLGKGN